MHVSIAFLYVASTVSSKLDGGLDHLYHTHLLLHNQRFVECYTKSYKVTLIAYALPNMSAYHQVLVETLAAAYYLPAQVLDSGYRGPKRTNVMSKPYSVH